MKNCSCIDSSSFVLYSSIMSTIIGGNLKPAEQDLLGNFFQLIGQNLTSMAAFTYDMDELCSNDILSF